MMAQSRGVLVHSAENSNSVLTKYTEVARGCVGATKPACVYSPVSATEPDPHGLATSVIYVMDSCVFPLWFTLGLDFIET
jgi:hypothetical protein